MAVVPRGETTAFFIMALGTRPQYKRKRKVEALYNVVETDHEGDIVEVRAVALKGIHLEKAQMGIKPLGTTSFQFAFQEGMAQFLMKFAITDLADGDWIFLNTGETELNPPTELPTGKTPRWEVRNIDKVGIGTQQQQRIHAQLRTSL